MTRTLDVPFMIAYGIGLTVAAFVGLLLLPPLLGCVSNALMGGGGVCLGVWRDIRAGHNPLDRIDFRFGLGALSILLPVLGQLALSDRPFIGENEVYVWPIAGSVVGPFLGGFVLLGIGAFRLRYPARFEHWFRPSRNARRSYLRQRIKELSDLERDRERERAATARERQRLEVELQKLEGASYRDSFHARSS